METDKATGLDLSFCLDGPGIYCEPGEMRSMPSFARIATVRGRNTCLSYATANFLQAFVQARLIGPNHTYTLAPVR